MRNDKTLPPRRIAARAAGRALRRRRVEGRYTPDNLESLTLDARLDLLNRVLEQIFIGEMPPKKKKQPAEAERNLLVEWLPKELQAHGASKLEHHSNTAWLSRHRSFSQNQ
jgi:hypothetical protein